MWWACAASGAVLAPAWVVSTAAALVGLRRVAELTRAEYAVPAATRLPRVSVIVPARNEAAMIEHAVRSLLTMNYPDYEIVAVDDRSEDATGAILDRLRGEYGARLRVVHVKELPAGWLGKTYAMNMAAAASDGGWLLFTDADIVFDPEALRRAVAYAEAQQSDHLVLLPTLQMENAGERMMISFFQAMFIFAGHRPWKVSDAKARDYLGVGAFNLVRRRAYEAIGTYDAMRLSVVDDMRLGQKIKQAGLRSQCAFGEDLVRVRWAIGAGGLVQNLTKNFFAQLGYNLALALEAAVALLWMQLGPWLGTAFAPGWTRAGHAVALACVWLVYAAMARRTKIGAGYTLLHPLATLLMVYALLRSTVVTLARGGVEWRGTFYSLKELRRAG